jgi:uncharacterized protein (DUF1501 family)
MRNRNDQRPDRILVVVELAGGNDGLDTIIPYRNETYRRVRPTLQVRSKAMLAADDQFGFHPSLVGMKRLYDDGMLCVVHGCGYPNPRRSHFSSMECWHTAYPNDLQTTGWIGRLADRAWPNLEAEAVVNIAMKESLAVRGECCSSLVFNNAEEFMRVGSSLQDTVYGRLIHRSDPRNADLRFLANVTRIARDASSRIRDAVLKYSTPVGYEATLLAQDLRKVAALVDAGFRTRVYYVTHNGFDTHAGQAGRRYYLLKGLGDALYSFQKDLKRMGRENDVCVMVFSEFGRRVEENGSAGTDHGSAGPMFIIGTCSNPGFQGDHPSLTNLDENGDLKVTVDFRRVYASVIRMWLGFREVSSTLGSDFEPLDLFSWRLSIVRD